MKPWNRAVLCVLIFICASCTSIKSKKVTDANKEAIIGEISTSKELTDAEKQLLTGYIVRQSLSTVFRGGKPSIPTGKTIGEMIEDQQKWIAQTEAEERHQKEKEQKLVAEIAAKQAALRDLVTVTLYSLKESDSGFLNGFEASIAFKAGGKDIRAFEGNLALSDVLGNSLGEIPVKVLKPLKANDTGTTKYGNAYMAFPELRGKHLDDVRAQWKPTKIILADSTELSVPDATD